MSVVHFVPCSGAEDPARIGALAAGLARHVLEESSDLKPGRRWLDVPARAAAAAAFAAWTEPLVAALPAEGPDALVASIGTLHPRSGWEGAIHALGVLPASPEDLSRLRDGVQPHVDRDICGGCGICVTLCQREGIRHNGHVAVIRPENCLACGDCLAECYLEALQFPHDGSRSLMERVAAAAATTSSGTLSVLFLLRPPTPGRLPRAAEMPRFDLGILAGSDPVAVDRAAADLIAAAKGRGLQELSECTVDPLFLLEEAERLGVGTVEHRMRRHDPVGLGC